MTGARLRTFFYITAERPHLRARRSEEATSIARRDAVYDGLSLCPQLLAQRLPCCLPPYLLPPAPRLITATLSLVPYLCWRQPGRLMPRRAVACWRGKSVRQATP